MGTGENKMQTTIIGITGGSGSGKTTMIRSLIKRFGDDIAVLYQDSYYHKHDDLPFSERKKLNYDHPDAFDMQLFYSHILALKNGEAVLQPVYDYSDHNRSSKTTLVEPRRVIVIDGLLLLHDKRIRDLIDIKIFVDAEADVRLVRRIQRDVKFRGRSIDSVTSQYINTVKPMHDLFIEPSKQYADLVVLHGGKNTAAMQLINSLVREVLSASEEG